jgi:hypothetical protein
VYLGNVISEGELKINPMKMEVILRRHTPTNVIEVRRFVGATQYLNKFITSFSIVASPLHAITINGKSF